MRRRRLMTGQSEVLIDKKKEQQALPKNVSCLEDEESQDGID
jgi:hypothetical protein